MARRALLVLVLLAACDRGHKAPQDRAHQKPAPTAPPKQPDVYTTQRGEMVTDQIEARGIKDAHVLTAMRLVPRHAFVPPNIRDHAYDDRALPIGFDKTISQPFIVATMTQAAHVKAGDKVLEIGTGSGYQAAVLAMMGAKVFTIEIQDELAARSRRVLDASGFSQVKLKTADGFYGWPEEAPFDVILVTCAAPNVPKPLLEQLKRGGRLVIPLGPADHENVASTKADDDTHQREDGMDRDLFGRRTSKNENAADRKTR